MYSKQQVDDMLELVEQEFKDAMTKNESSEEVEIETEEIEVEMAKSEEEVEEVEIESEDYQSIDDLYSSMDKSEKEAHYEAAKKALFNETTEEIAPIAKSEEEVEEVEIETMAKSEFDAIKAENEELKKSNTEINDLLEQMFNVKKAPEQRAVTGLNVIKKSEGAVEIKEDIVASMNKSEISQKLKSIDYSDLSKSERNAINEYCLNNGSVDSIKHLITK